MPETAAVLEGKFAATTLAPDAAALVLWTMVDGGRAGDKVTLRLLAPEGAALAEQTTTLEKDQMQILRAVGRRRQGERWPAGEYRGEVVVETAGTANAPAVERRDGRVLTVTAPQTP